MSVPSLSSVVWDLVTSDPSPVSQHLCRSQTCHLAVMSAPLRSFTVTVVSGCLAPQSPWLLPQEGVREGGRSHLPLPYSDGGERRAWSSAWLLEIQHMVLPKTIPIGGREEEKARWNDCTVATTDNVGSFEVKNCAYGDSKVTQDQFSFC